jgi:GNAT superfamily N-acetyltransferase
MHTSGKKKVMTKSKQIHIRQASPADAALLTRLIRDSFRDVADRFGLTPDNCPRHPSNCTGEWIERDLVRGVIYYILESDGTPVGCAAIEHASPEVCYLERLAVLPEERRKGFGKALVDNVLLKARTLGVVEVDIGTIAHHTELKDWYIGLGFVEGETKDFPHLPFRVTFMNFQL